MKHNPSAKGSRRMEFITTIKSNSVFNFKFLIASAIKSDRARESLARQDDPWEMQSQSGWSRLIFKYLPRHTATRLPPRHQPAAGQEALRLLNESLILSSLSQSSYGQLPQFPGSKSPRAVDQLKSRFPDDGTRPVLPSPFCR